MELYQTIFKRKSIRNFDMNTLDESVIKDIEEYIKTIKPYKEDIKVETYILNDEKQIAGMFKVKAPHYIAITSEVKNDYLVNVGYILEQLVLYLTSKEIGTCWLGGSKPIEKLDEANPLDFVVMVAFGKAKEPLYRENISEFKRKDITEISNLTKSDDIMEAVRLSPSAVNKQSWYFDVNENSIEVYQKQVMKLTEKMTKIDMGIAISHLYIAAMSKGKNLQYIKEENKQKKGYEYIVTCKII